MIKIHESAKSHFKKVCRFARDSKKMDSFRQCIESLHNYRSREETKCVLYKDSAPASFAFNLYFITPDGKEELWLNGGIIYHGPLDGYGSGSGPTYSVCVTPTDGWSIHT